MAISAPTQCDVVRRTTAGTLRENCGICGDSTAKSIVMGWVVEDFKGRNPRFFVRPYTHLKQNEWQSSYARDPNDLTMDKCCRKGCSECSNGKEVVYTHMFCAKVARHHLSRKLCMRMWVGMSWPTPWKNAPRLEVMPSLLKVDFTVFDRIGIPDMRKLPQEVVQMIYELSRDNMFWRVMKAKAFMKKLIAEPEGESLAVPAHHVESWDRTTGRAVINRCSLCHSEECSCKDNVMVQVAIDMKGIVKIGELAINDSCEQLRLRHPQYRFVITSYARLTGVKALFKHGRARLEFPEGVSAPPIWDAPKFFDFLQQKLSPEEPFPHGQYRTADLRKVSGLTFFYDGSICAVHAHTKESPWASSTYHTIPVLRRRLVSWCYIPINPKDTILSWDVKNKIPQPDGDPRGFNLIRFKLAGDVMFGRVAGPGQMTLDFQQTRNPTAIAWCSLPGRDVELFDNYLHPDPDTPPEERHITVDFPELPPFPTCYTRAPLEGVIHLTLFVKRDLPYCTGMLFTYQNGATRAIGQCRLGLDHEDHYPYPKHLCFSHIPGFATPHFVDRNIPTSYFLVDPEKHNWPKGSFRCCTMDGVLECWTSGDRTWFSFKKNEGTATSAEAIASEEGFQFVEISAPPPEIHHRYGEWYSGIGP